MTSPDTDALRRLQHDLDEAAAHAERALAMHEALPAHPGAAASIAAVQTALIALTETVQVHLQQPSHSGTHEELTTLRAQVADLQVRSRVATIIAGTLFGILVAVCTLFLAEMVHLVWFTP